MHSRFPIVNDFGVIKVLFATYPPVVHKNVDKVDGPAEHRLRRVALV